MNTYIITATRENGTTFTEKMTAASAAEARKDFREVYRHGKFSITGCDVFAENVCATKEQERKALEQIKAIVATLGPNSYLATAFEGAFEDAEVNIENDFGDSMKRRWEASEKTVEKLKVQIESKEKECAEGARKIEDLQAENKALRKQLLSEDDLHDIEQMIRDLEDSDEVSAGKAAEEIVKLADDPTSSAFLSAVTNHRAFANRVNYNRQLRQRVEYAHAARHATV